MGRIISDERKQQIMAARVANPDALGPLLAELAIDGSVPIEGIASVLRVSEPTVYRWMYGNSEPRDADKIAKIKNLITTLRKAKRAKALPLEGSTRIRVAKFYDVVTEFRPLKQQ